MNRTLGLIGLGLAAYILYRYSKKQEPAPAPAPIRTQAQITKTNLKREGEKVIEAHLESEATKAAEKRFKQRNSANDILLFTGEKQYVTLENLIPNRYGQYNNFYGNYNRLNAENTTDIISAERTQALYKRPKPMFNNTL